MKAIVFDFDGVLADSFELGKNIAKEVGHDVDDEIWRSHHDGNALEKPVVPFTKESAENFFSKYLERVTSVKLFFKPEHLQMLKKTYPLYIISSNRKSSIEKFLNHYGLNFFDEILGEEFHRSKVEKFNFLFEKYHLKPDDIIFISDTLGDILEAKKVQVKTIAVDFGFHNRARLDKGEPYKIVSSIDELFSEINKI